MKKRCMLLGIAAVLLLAAMLIPIGDPDVRTVVHQHQSFPAEDPAQTGFLPDGSLRSHLPLIVIHTDGAPVPGVLRTDPNRLRCSYSVMDRRSGSNSTTDTPVLSGWLDLSVRGNSSREFPKKQYSVKLLDEDGHPQKQPLLGMTAHSRWVLNGSFLDHSMIRDYMLYNLSGEIMKGFTPACRLCEVLFTDAAGNTVYQGVYTLIEKISVSPERLNLEPYDPGYAESSFLLQMNNHHDHFSIPHLKPADIPAYPFDLEYPRMEDLTPETLSYIQRELLIFEKALHDAYISKNWKKVDKMIDLESFVDYFIINEFFQNYDAGHRSIFLHRDLDGKFCMGPVWDFDGSLNNYAGIDLNPTHFKLSESLYYQYLMQNPDFVRMCVRRFRILRQGILSEEHLKTYLQEASDYLGTAGIRNTQKWYPESPDGAAADVEKMKDFIEVRGQWLDRHLEEVSAIID